MQCIEYRRWAPSASSLSVEYPAELVSALGKAESCGPLYGSRSGRNVRVQSLRTDPDEELEKVGVFVSRIRGEVFLTESDLAFMGEQDLALVGAGNRAGFFAREIDGSIQTVRSHLEFSTCDGPPRPPQEARVLRRGIPAGAIALGLSPVIALAAVAALPRAPTLRSIEVRQIDREVRISWEPAQNAILTIDDSGGQVSIAVYPDETSLTYAPRGRELEVALTGMDQSNHRRRIMTHYAADGIWPGR